MENTPRRLKRFKRKTEKKPLLKELKSLSKKRKFTETLKIEEENPDQIAENIFEQIKRKEEKQEKKKQEKNKKSSEKKLPFEKRQVAKTESPFGKKQDTKTEEEIPFWKKRRMQRIEKPEAETELPFKKKQVAKTKGKTGKETFEEKREKRIQRKHGRKETEEPPFSEKGRLPKTQEEEITELKGTEIKGLFGDAEEKKGKIKKTDEMKLDLDEMPEMEELDEEGEERIFDLEKEEPPFEKRQVAKTKGKKEQELEKGKGKIQKNKKPKLEELEEESGKGKCINCGKPFNELVFCSKCGNAFCDNCAKIKQKEGTKTKYVCPHCGYVTKK